MVTEVTCEAPLRAPLGIEVKPSRKTTEQVQLEKALFPMVVTDNGMVISVRPEQPSKAYDPIDVTDDGMVISVRPEQSTKA